MLEFSLLDMTPYSRDVYFEIVGLYNEEVWPLQIPLLAVSLWMLITTFIRDLGRSKIVWWLMGGAWFWCGVVFQMQHYASINWAGEAFGYLFLIQSAVIVFVAQFGQFSSKGEMTVLSWQTYQVLMVLGLVIYPLASVFEGREISQIELFGLMPTPTLIVLFALSLWISGWKRYVLVLIPLIWSVISASFAWTLGLVELYAILASIVIWILGVCGSCLTIKE